MPAVPRRKLEKRVGAEQHAQRPRGARFAPQFGQSLNRVSGTAALDFAIIHRQQRIAGCG